MCAIRCFVQVFRDKLGLDATLPFSKATIHPQEVIVIPEWLRPHRFLVRVTSAFVALSGHKDTASTLSSLCGSLRSGLYLDPLIVPLLDLPSLPSNAYLYDFFKHGQKTAILRYNKVPNLSLALI